MSLSVKIDTSFVIPLLKYLGGSKETDIYSITDHPAARQVYSHALRFNNTKKGTVQEFWKDITKDLSKDYKVLVSRVKSALTYLYNETQSFDLMIKDLWNYIPNGTKLRCELYAMLGYDIGIVSEGHALINLAHPLFEKDPREILYLSMHELHHVVYTSFNPIYDLKNIFTIENLVEMIKYSTHLEGLAVYAALEARKRTKSFSHPDYQVLQDTGKRNSLVTEFFNILTKLEFDKIRSVHENDWNTIELMSGKKRLWYIAGAHMAEVIDKKLGRDALNDTIRHGPNEFFKSYHDSL
ncbi:MAG: DUF5700 domain-containing putative Zn-dependent protease [Candidatus Thorarchaeota archaeon]